MTAREPVTPRLRVIRYRFTSPAHGTREFAVQLQADTLAVVRRPGSSLPDWTALAYWQCPNCPLRPAEHAHCPVAASLVDIVDVFGSASSAEPAEIEVSTDSHRCLKQGLLMEGLSGLIGLHMVTAGCPHLDKLRPMVLTHLPFATLEQTTYRAAAMYRLAMYLRRRRGLDADETLDGLATIYQEILTVNDTFHRRLTGIHLADANLNALFRLDTYAQSANHRLVAENLDKLDALFHPYLA
jgi:hypothetical protein